MKINKNSKFYTPPTFEQRLDNIKYGILFWKGRKKGMIHTQNITMDHIRSIFFPKSFSEKYSYLGSVPYSDEKTMLHALVIAMDGEARPGWCPKWFLRFLHLFGNDNSIVRVRNRFLNQLHNRITNGVFLWDYKTKWHNYDLRISLTGPKHLNELAYAIEKHTYDVGYREDLIDQIKTYEPEFKETWQSSNVLWEHLNKLEDDNDNK
jgi:hypothetical protein